MTVEPLSIYDSGLQKLFSVMTHEGMEHASQGFACMVGHPLAAAKPRLRFVAFSELSTLFEGPENSAVGIYLRAKGALAGQMILVLDYARALEMVDLMTSVPLGETRQLGKFECSALAELGNLTGTLFLNALARYMGLETRPTPPSVMVDMMATILDVVAISYDSQSQYVLLLQAAFLRDDHTVDANFCVIPDAGVLEKLAIHLAAYPPTPVC